MQETPDARLAVLEAGMATLSRRVDALETLPATVAGLKGWIAGATAVTVVVVPLLVRLLTGGS